MGIGHVEDRFSMRTRWALVMVFAIAMACVEAAANSTQPAGRREFPSRGSSLCCGFWRDSAACGAVAQRSAGYVSVDVPVMRTVTTHSGGGFMVQARFAGDGRIYLRRQKRGFRGISLESHRPLTVW
jgi:hypothetical protein